jgi:hypothetical protein
LTDARRQYGFRGHELGAAGALDLEDDFAAWLADPGRAFMPGREAIAANLALVGLFHFILSMSGDAIRVVRFMPSPCLDC